MGERQPEGRAKPHAGQGWEEEGHSTASSAFTPPACASPAACDGSASVGGVGEEGEGERVMDTNADDSDDSSPSSPPADAGADAIHRADAAAAVSAERKEIERERERERERAEVEGEGEGEEQGRAAASALAEAAAAGESRAEQTRRPSQQRRSHTSHASRRTGTTQPPTTSTCPAQHLSSPSPQKCHRSLTPRAAFQTPSRRLPRVSSPTGTRSDALIHS